MLRPEHLYYPEKMGVREVIERVKRVLAQSDEGGVFGDPRLDLANFIQRACWQYGVNPVWLLVSMQREQSLIADNGQAASERAWSRALGVVGQHTAGTANDTWDGLPSQILLAAKSAGWLGNIGPRENFGYRPGLWPSALRWAPGRRVELLNPDGSYNRTHICGDEMEFVELGYTPDCTEKAPGLLRVRATNWDIFKKYVEGPFYA